MFRLLKAFNVNSTVSLYDHLFLPIGPNEQPIGLIKQHNKQRFNLGFLYLKKNKKKINGVIVVYAASGENSCADNPGAYVRHWSIY